MTETQASRAWGWENRMHELQKTLRRKKKSIALRYRKVKQIEGPWLNGTEDDEAVKRKVEQVYDEIEDLARDIVIITWFLTMTWHRDVERDPLSGVYEPCSRSARTGI